LAVRDKNVYVDRTWPYRCENDGNGARTIRCKGGVGAIFRTHIAGALKLGDLNFSLGLIGYGDLERIARSVRTDVPEIEGRRRGAKTIGGSLNRNRDVEESVLRAKRVAGDDASLTRADRGNGAYLPTMATAGFSEESDKYVDSVTSSSCPLGNLA
jgi:hypothetical protein